MSESPGQNMSAHYVGCVFRERTTSRGYETGARAWARPITRGHWRHRLKKRFAGQTWPRVTTRVRRYRLRTSMVRRGSTVRVRQRACRKSLHIGWFCLLFGRSSGRSTSTRRRNDSINDRIKESERARQGLTTSLRGRASPPWLREKRQVRRPRRPAGLDCATLQRALLSGRLARAPACAGQGAVYGAFRSDRNFRPDLAH